ncbi:TonB-dependent receptor [Lysobacter yangpyeongensis]|uniref:TonB-dependent receptor n=1 Tax=Lysobacter yangpyeongensis TaxID=346182 RepID=A0ABW0SLY7_9GAMM
MSPSKNRLAVALAYALFGCATLGIVPASAQEAAPAQRTATDLDAITVTAQSREQELQDVPIALQVVDERLLDDVAAEDLGDIDSFVPGLKVNSLQPTQPSFQLRGIETDDFGIGTDPAVGVYVDGVYAGRGGGVLLPFTDVQRIEVLKGPQGTLFGRNTAAGAISIITNRPGDETHASGKLRLGNDNKTYVEGMANIAVSENSAFRFNGLFNHSDGWLHDAVTGEELNPDNNWATRAAFQTRFGDDTRAWIAWDHESLDQKGQATTGIVAVPVLPALPTAPADSDAFLDPLDVPTASDAANGETREFDGVTLIVDHNLGWGSLTSTTAWHQYDSLNRVEEDGTNLSYLYVDSTNTESNENFYQEFKFSGSTDHLDWIAGVSYFQEEAGQTSEVNVLTDSVDTLAQNLGLAPPGGLFGPVSDLANFFGIPVNLRGLPWNEKFVNSLDTKAYAAFGDVIWRVSDKLNLTAGLRYTRDEKDFTWFNDLRSAPELDAQLDLLDALGFFDAIGLPKETFVFDVAFVDPPAVMNKGVLNRAKKSWDDWSPRLVADYHFTDDLMGFASLAKGYKAGGFNALQIGSEFENEDVWNFETGIKHALPEYRLAYNASAFYYVYSNRQAVTLDMSTSIPRFVVNTSDQEAWGVDFDLRWQATDGLGFDFNAEYLDSSYKDYVNPQGVDLGGQPTGAPAWSFSAGANYVWRLAEKGDVRAAMRYSYVGDCRENDESETQLSCGRFGAIDMGEAQQILDARIGWTSPNGHWNWAVYGNNLLDNQYVNSLGTYGLTVLGTVGARVTEPRSYGVEVGVKF